MSTALIVVDSQILSGEPVFAGTRVPVAYLFGHLAAGDTIDDFLAGYPSVSREQALAVLEAAKTELFARAA